MLLLRLCRKHYSLITHKRILLAFSRHKHYSVLFYGSDTFSIPSLKILHENYSVNTIIDNLQIVTKYDKNIVSKYAHKNNIVTHQWPYHVPHDCYDIGVIASFGHMIPSKVINVFKFGMINVHASLLPELRGAAPIQHAILKDYRITGCTIMRIKPKKFDTGDIILQKEYVINPRVTAVELLPQLANVGAQLLWECFTNLEVNLKNAKPQPEYGITNAPKIKPSDGEIIWSEMTDVDIDRRFRAFNGFIDIFTYWTDGTQMKLYDIIDLNIVSKLPLNELSGYERPEPGMVYYHPKLKLLCVSCSGQRWTAFGSVTLKGRKNISALQFNNGHLKKYKNISDVRLGFKSLINK